MVAERSAICVPLVALMLLNATILPLFWITNARPLAAKTTPVGWVRPPHTSSSRKLAGTDAPLSAAPGAAVNGSIRTMIASEANRLA